MIAVAAERNWASSRAAALKNSLSAVVALGVRVPGDDDVGVGGAVAVSDAVTAMASGDKRDHCGQRYPQARVRIG